MQTKEPYTYFQPGEMLFLLSHEHNEQINIRVDRQEKNAENPSPFDTVIDRWLAEINKMVKDKIKGGELPIESSKKSPAELTIEPYPEYEIHFAGNRLDEKLSAQESDHPDEKQPSGPERRGAFSLIPVKVGWPGKDWLGDDDLDRLEGNELAALMHWLDNERQTLAKLLQGQRKVQSEWINVDAVLLNWLSSPASEYGGGGGPSGRPEPYQGDLGKVPYQFDILNAQPLLPTGEHKGNCGKGVTVAILDTAPSLHDLAAVYERYHKLKPGNRKESHRLIETLLSPKDHFHVHPASLADLLRMRAVHLRDHNYEMSDHGLFVAGIINTIAPEAEIHLYEVLNSNGVGDLVSIATGLRKVLNSFPDRPLLVNCSFVLNIPLLNQPINDLPLEILKILGGDVDPPLGQEYLTCTSTDGDDWITRQGWAIQWICDHFHLQGSHVIAAAGNDWKYDENKTRPQARFPAAFESVLGVGALPKDAQPDPVTSKYSPASYSNLSDAPGKFGVITLGGEYGEAKGVLGVYLGKFPPGEFALQKSLEHWKLLYKIIAALWPEKFLGPENKYNWAWWSGTSFATPIVTGLIASAFSDLGRPAIAEDAIQKLQYLKVIQASQTTSDEAGIVGVQQIWIP